MSESDFSGVFPIYNVINVYTFIAFSRGRIRKNKGSHYTCVSLLVFVHCIIVQHVLP